MDPFIKISTVHSALAISKPTLYRWISEKKFVAPIPLGANTSVIRESELIAYMNRVVAGEDRETITKDLELKRTQQPLMKTH
ncbi:hypothetical protein BCT61_05555 [Vibrio breoganii]|uniref:helix-turn-helix transcriptional regulator n=1 Tax=Vibrio breoganii TaxID=553239 RepID=UPI000C841E8E|nr:AlpA family phage regulatory protein [Vibrio breoganii]PMM12489.1 hypothetical protein BCT61_05555 [Vibrio breoganii]